MTAKQKQNKNLIAIWSFLIGKNKIETTTVEEIKFEAEKRGLTVECAKEIDFGYNPKIKAIQIQTNEGVAIYPKQHLENIEIYQNNIKSSQIEDEFWKSVDWFFPPYKSRHEVYSELEQVGVNFFTFKQLSKEEIQTRFENCLSSIYNFENIIPITSQILPNSIIATKHVPLIKESIMAFYCGMKVAAIAALIPMIESLLTSIIGEDKSNYDLISKVEHSIDKALDKVKENHKNSADWIPPEYMDNSVLKVMNERVLMLETIRGWLINSFYVKTENYNSKSGFNRHFFAHAKSDVWQNTSNFFRGIGLLQALVFIECFAVENSNVSLMIPAPDKRSESFRLDVFACLNYQCMKQHILQNIQLGKSLPFNPTASDDGWLLRASKLSETMNEEIIPRLRKQGWNCYNFIDPVKNGEFITINARKDDKREIKVALIYSCATSNQIYKMLDSSCNYILYQGAYYKQDSYAYGVNAEVMPISAWLAPE